MKRRTWMMAAAWLAGVAAAWAQAGTVIAFRGIEGERGGIDAGMNRVLKAELASRGIEARFAGEDGEDEAGFYGSGRVEGTRVTKVRSSGGDSPTTERMAFARCHLSVGRFGADGEREALFDGAVLVPASGEPPDFETDVPKSLAERIADVVEAAGLVAPVLEEVEGQEADAEGHRGEEDEK